MINFLTVLQKALNHYLSLDPESQFHLKRLQNKHIQIKLIGLGLIFRLSFSENGIELADNSTVEKGQVILPDTLITGMPLSLLRMALARTDRKKFFSKDVKVEGDLELAQQVIDLFDQLEIDWEEMLAKKVGDVPAHQMGKVFNKFKDWCKHTRSALRQDTVDYLHEEKLWFPERELLQEFFDGVDAIRMDVDRLEAMLKRLKEQV
jgi:ubiquinone biosynthesis accessory factor UbiJ